MSNVPTLGHADPRLAPRNGAPSWGLASLFSGVALLSIHSMLAGAGIIIGTYVMTHYLYREVGCAI